MSCPWIILGIRPIWRIHSLTLMISGLRLILLLITVWAESRQITICGQATANASGPLSIHHRVIMQADVWRALTNSGVDLGGASSNRLRGRFPNFLRAL